MACARDEPRNVAATSARLSTSEIIGTAAFVFDGAFGFLTGPPAVASAVVSHSMTDSRPWLIGFASAPRSDDGSGVSSSRTTLIDLGLVFLRTVSVSAAALVAGVFPHR